MPGFIHWMNKRDIFTGCYLHIIWNYGGGVNLKKTLLPHFRQTDSGSYGNIEAKIYLYVRSDITKNTFTRVRSWTLKMRSKTTKENPNELMFFIFSASKINTVDRPFAVFCGVCQKNVSTCMFSSWPSNSEIDVDVNAFSSQWQIQLFFSTWF